MKSISVRRTRLSMVLTFFVAMLALLASPSTAFAGGGTGGGGSGGSVGSPGGGVNTSYAYVCGAGNQGYQVGGGRTVLRYIGTFLRCNGQQNDWQSERAYRYCLVGFETFRFYGRPNQRPGAWTRSEVGLQSWCQDSVTALFWLPHPEDDPQGLGGATWGTRKGVNQQNQPFYTSASNYPTSSPPFERSAQNCTAYAVGTAARPDPLAKYFNKSDPSYDKYRPLRKSLYDLYNSQKNGPLGIDGALAVINSRRPAPTGPDNINYNDNRKCSSDMDFASDGNAAGVQFGTCYIPVVKRAQVFHSTNNASVKNYGYFIDDLGGSRYSRDYGAKNDNPQYRSLIKAIVAGSRNGAGASYTNDAASLSFTPMSDRNAAAADASKYARCLTGKGSTFNSKGDSQKAPVADGVTLKVNAPDYLQVGGAANPGSASVTNTGLMCAGQPCSITYKNGLVPYLGQLHYGIDMQGINGYRKCSQVSQNGCDFAVAPGSSTRNVTGWFYSATQANVSGTSDEKVRIRLTAGDDPSRSEPWGTYWQPRRETVTFTRQINTAAVGQPPVMTSVTYTVTRNLPPLELNLQVNIEDVNDPSRSFPSDLPVLGATSDPN